MEAPKTNGRRFVEEVENKPCEPLLLGKRDQRQSSHWIETIDVEGMQLIQCLVKAVFRILGCVGCSGEGENCCAVGTSRPFGEPVCFQLLLLSFETMFPQGTHNGSDIRKHAPCLIVSPNLNRFSPLLRPVAMAFHSNTPPRRQTPRTVRVLRWCVPSPIRETTHPKGFAVLLPFGVVPRLRTVGDVHRLDCPAKIIVGEWWGYFPYLAAPGPSRQRQERLCFA